MKGMNKAKMRYMAFLEKQGKMPKKEEMDIPSYAFGGMIDEEADEEDNFDWIMGHAHDFDSSGEPHTANKFEDEQPMEFMSHGGKVIGKKMFKGGKISQKMKGPSFALALKKRF